MLDPIKLLRALASTVGDAHVDATAEHALALELWRRVVADPAFTYKIRQLTVPWHMPTWQAGLGDWFSSAPGAQASYNALAVDGSQIYPDRHQGTSWYLINMGCVAISYDALAPRVLFDNYPAVFTGEGDEDAAYAGLVGVDRVNARRQELELSAGISWYPVVQSPEAPKKQILFYDGALIFWHLASREGAARQVILARYGTLLQEMAAAECVVAGYISAPKSKDLVHLLSAQLMLEGADADQAMARLAHVLDASLLADILPPGYRTALFCPTVPICALYPPGTQPYFFYMSVGCEVVRIELPAWLAASAQVIDFIAWAAYDQALKGQGYPVVIAESHEQAVVRSADREFFYEAIDKVTGQNVRLISQKSIKKRSIGF